MIRYMRGNVCLNVGRSEGNHFVKQMVVTVSFTKQLDQSYQRLIVPRLFPQQNHKSRHAKEEREMNVLTVMASCFSCQLITFLWSSTSLFVDCQRRPFALSRESRGCDEGRPMKFNIAQFFRLLPR